MRYDVVIVGAGPAGLKAAEVLASEGKKVIVFEKNRVIGKKVCAAGITEKDLEYIPRELIERKFDSLFLVSKNTLRIRNNFYTIEREKLGRYQANKAKKAGAEIKTGCFVKKINRNSVIAGSKKYFFDFLIGADGSNSSVRKFLGLESGLVALAVQYKLNSIAKNLEAHYNPEKYSFWYAWIFPHKKYTYIGTAVPLKSKRAKKIKKMLDSFAKQNNLDIKGAKLEAAMLNADYRGFKFGNIFLAGDAAGLVNPFTGEGIYQALVSGEETAKKIIDPAYGCGKLERIIRKNKKLVRMGLPIFKIPFLLNVLCRLGFRLLKYKRFSNKVISAFLDY